MTWGLIVAGVIIAFLTGIVMISVFKVRHVGWVTLVQFLATFLGCLGIVTALGPTPTNIWAAVLTCALIALPIVALMAALRLLFGPLDRSGGGVIPQKSDEPAEHLRKRAS